MEAHFRYGIKKNKKKVIVTPYFTIQTFFLAILGLHLTISQSDFFLTI